MTYVSRIRAAALVAASLLVTACNGGGKALPPSSPGIGTFPQGSSGFSWGSDYLRGAAYEGPASFGALGVNVQVTMRDLPGLLAYARGVSDPYSPMYRRFLSPLEIGDRFGASAADYAAVARYFAGHGLHVGGWPQREVLFVAGPQANLESAFGTKFGLYEKDGRGFVAPISAPHLAGPLPIAAVQGLVNVHLWKRDLIQGPPVRAGSNTYAGGYSPQQIQNAYDFTGAYRAGFTGSGITIGIIGTGGISAADVPAYAKAFHISAAPVTEVAATDSGEAAGLTQSGIPTPNPNPSSSPHPPYAFGDFGLATPPPVTAPCDASYSSVSDFPSPTCNPEDGEAQLDTEQTAGLAPGASVLFYLAYNPADCKPSGGTNPCTAQGGPPDAAGAQGLAVADDEIQQAISDDRADVLSLSYGGGEKDNVGFYFDGSGNGYGPMEFATLAAEGIAVFVSSGDSGAQECSQAGPCVSYPGGDPSVTSVGGVTMPLDEWGRVTGQITAWGSQTSSGLTGSGGGTSTVFAAPPWQSRNVSGVTMREQPDVALTGDPFTGVFMLQNAFSRSAESLGAIGGTSVAAPEMAAMWALVLQACAKSPSCATAGGAAPYRLGNAAPLFYAIYGGAFSGARGNRSAFVPQLPYAQVFYDVVYGNSAQTGQQNPVPPPPRCCFVAGPGYDEVTGVGVPFAGHLIQAVTGQAVP